MKNLLVSGILFVFFGICFSIQAQIPCGSPSGGNCTNPASDYSHIVWRNPSDLFNTPLSAAPLSEVNQNLFYFTDDIPPVPFLGCPNGVPRTTINDFGVTNFTTGDEIGIFYERNDTLFCVGYCVHLNDASSTESIVVYGDDIGTPIQESYGDGEPFEIMLIRKNGIANYYINFEIDGVNNYPCGNVSADPNGDFTDRVDSRLESMTVLDCAGIEGGPNRLDNCGICDDDSSNDNTTCFSCDDPTACNYIADATNIDNSICDYGNTDCADPCNFILGCTNFNSFNFDPLANCDDNSCYNGTSCNDPSACNYDPDVVTEDNSTCDYGDTFCPDPCNIVYGCTDPISSNYNPNANCYDHNACNANYLTPICQDPNACNYSEDGSCNYGDSNCPDPCNVVLGCIIPTACNFDPNATCDDGSCDLGDASCPDPCLPIFGCTNADACNYNSMACADDGSCIEIFLNTGLGRDGALYGITNFPISGNEIYTWYNGNDEQVAQFTNNPYFAPSEIGTYYLVVSDPDYPDCTQLLGPATITDLHGCCELESDGN